jgi:hypothetical protein
MIHFAEKKYSGNGAGRWGYKNMYASIMHYLSETLIERKRLLPGPAKILVRRGQEVVAIDPVVEELIVPAHQILDLVRGLGVPVERADQFIHCKAGFSVAKGDLLAGPVGLTRRVMRAPQAGKIISIGQGTILLELAGRPRQRAAGMSGEVVDLISERGVMIRSFGALIQGVWGNGRIGHGKLRLALENPDQELTISQLLDRADDSILVSGYCSDPIVLATAARVSLRGIVLAGLHPSLISQANRLEIPLLLLEGFGRHSINPEACKIMSSYEDQPVALNAEPADILLGTRPELVIPRSAYSHSIKPVSLDLFAPGKMVRLIGPAELGRLGVLMDLIGDVRLPNGLLAESARVQLESGELVNFPLANLEILV